MTASAAAPWGDRFRRSSGILALLLALGVMGGFYAAFAPKSYAEEGSSSSADVTDGQKLFATGCASCHGRNAQGIKDRGPSLVGVGASSVEFQVSSGRMPLARQEAQAQRKPPRYTDEEIKQLAAYVQSLGGGPQLPAGNVLRDGDLAQGGRLFRTNCASCHSFSSNGGALSSGKFAPSLEHATDRQIYAAMQSGPQNMPVFGDAQLTPQEKQSIIKFVQSLKAEKDPGGMGIGRTGPVPEGLVIFLIGLVVLLFAAVWIAGKS
jgi:ubiquinol-cytochrome c reductase cytochrome c subunit